jgi:hypothetical protein
VEPPTAHVAVTGRPGKLYSRGHVRSLTVNREGGDNEVHHLDVHVRPVARRIHAQWRDVVLRATGLRRWGDDERVTHSS